jgi:chemotaxis protein CheD
MGEASMVGMAEIKVTSRTDDVLITLGLGSCIGICAYDAEAHIAGMAHVVLPVSSGQNAVPGKFANTAVPELLRLMTEAGAKMSRIQVALVGGAQLFTSRGTGSKADIGPRNAEAVRRELSHYPCRFIAQDTGGSAGRTVYLFGDGRIRVKTIGQGERELVNLGKAPLVPQLVIV